MEKKDMKEKIIYILENISVLFVITNMILIPVVTFALFLNWVSMAKVIVTIQSIFFCTTVISVYMQHENK